MDKATRALELAEQNAAAVASLKKRRVAVFHGTATGSITSFGKIPSGVAIVRFDGGSCALFSGNGMVAAGSSPLIAEVSAGELYLAEERTNATAVVLK